MQGASGLGLEAQSEAISRFAKAERLKIADTFAEVETLEPPTPGFGISVVSASPAAAVISSFQRVNGAQHLSHLGLSLAVLTSLGPRRSP